MGSVHDISLARMKRKMREIERAPQPTVEEIAQAWDHWQQADDVAEYEWEIDPDEDADG